MTDFSDSNSAVVVTGLLMGLGDETAETHHRVQGPVARLIGGRASHLWKRAMLVRGGHRPQ